MSNKFGLIERDIKNINDSIEQFPEIEEVILFGSRARGNFKRGSDVDLAIKGNGITHETVLRFSDILNEVKPLPYFFDILAFNKITEPRLLAQVNQGKIIYPTGG